MASNFLEIQIHYAPFSLSKTLCQPSNKLSFFPKKSLQIQKLPSFSLYSSPSSVSSPTPPTSKQEAVLQAKTCLSTTLQKPLNSPKLAGKLKKQKQPRFRVEIPVADDSPELIAQLAFDIFGDLHIRRKGSRVKILLIWPNPTLRESAMKVFESLPVTLIEHVDLTRVMTIDNRILNSADTAVFLAPEDSELAIMKTVSDYLYPKPLVLFNPKWGFEEESGFGEFSGFAGSFVVVYAFLGLEVRGILSKRNGMIYRCVRDGVLSGERWYVLVEEEGALKVISTFKLRPSITEVENVLYNMMAANSPITKSAKFLRNMVANVTGKK